MLNRSGPLATWAFAWRSTVAAKVESPTDASATTAREHLRASLNSIRELPSGMHIAVKRGDAHISVSDAAAQSVEQPILSTSCSQPQREEPIAEVEPVPSMSCSQPQRTELIAEVEPVPSTSCTQPQHTGLITEVDPDSLGGHHIFSARLLREGFETPPMPPIAPGYPAPVLRQAPPSRRRPNGEPFWFFLPESKARGAAPYSRRPPRRRF